MSLSKSAYRRYKIIDSLIRSTIKPYPSMIDIQEACLDKLDFFPPVVTIEKDIDMLEKIQRRATRMIPGIGKLNYEERLKECSLTTLEQRRKRGDMIRMFRMTNEYSSFDMTSSLCYTSQRHDVQTRSFINKSLVPEKCRLDVRKHFFTNRSAQAWNCLPIDVREAESVNIFKNMYDDWMFNQIE